MSITDWSDSITIAELTPEPEFSDDMGNLIGKVEERQENNEKSPDVILNLEQVEYLNSSNIAQLVANISVGGAVYKELNIRTRW